FGEISQELKTGADVKRNWDAIKREGQTDEQVFFDVPESLPGLLYAHKTQRRAAGVGFDWDHVPFEAVEEELGELKDAESN
ncbi:nucleoside triphosphate pyrophosphohydrolase, partial [Escherichia coli]